MAHDVFSDSALLHIPTKRAAWSDRAALLMAGMSKIAYKKFELIPGGDKKYDQSQLNEMLERMLEPGGGTSSAASDGEEPEDQRPEPTKEALELQEDLRKAGFVLAGLFNDNSTDTQAFLAAADSNLPADKRPFGDLDVSVLSFRGTEKGVNDWITNLNILQKETPIPGTKHEALIHSGFQRAFNSVKLAILSKLTPLTDGGSTLYLTGHSLGGALALIATRDIARGSHGSCYTFGSPRVGRFGFADYIKTPIYRVVNANDLVPRIPPAYIPTILMYVVQILNVPFAGLLKRLLRKIEKYVHHGDMRFLRRSDPPNYEDLEVRSNPSVIYRFFWYWPALFANKKGPIDAPLGDHSIELYYNKLAAYATARIAAEFEDDSPSDDTE